MDELTLCPLVSIHNFGCTDETTTWYGTLEGYSYGTDLYEVYSENHGLFLCYAHELKAENEYGAALLLSIKEGFTPPVDTLIMHDTLALCYKDVPYEVISSWPKEAFKRIEKWCSERMKGNKPEEPAELKEY